MKNVIIAGMILLFGTGTAFASSSNYIDALADGTWSQGIQAQTVSRPSFSPEEDGNFVDAITDGSWLNGVPQRYVDNTSAASSNTILSLADGTWFKTFNSQPVADVTDVRR